MSLLLSSVFGPFGVDDAYGRKENVMELFHNQVTREQGVFSLRYNHPSFGLHFIAENLDEPTTILDFPSEQRFIDEIRQGYDYVGIAFITPNFAKAKRMAELVRRHAPQSKIILGSHGTRIPNIEQMIEHDHICRGEGVKFMRRLLGEKVDRPFKHPNVRAGMSKRMVGIPMKSQAAVLIPGVGCPNACRFCATSHFFDKTYTPFLDTGRALFDACQKAERELGVTEFFVMDENFLKRPERAYELLKLMEENDKPYRFGIFSSAETIADVGVEFMARLGVYFLWIGVESKKETYAKNQGIDLKQMIGDLRDHGVAVLASGILFSEHHDKTTIWEDIEFVAGLGSDLVQYMQLGPLPMTKLYMDYDQQGRLLKDLPFEEWHGQHRLWFKHPNFTAEESERFLRDAFRYDYDQNGSSLLRMTETLLRGYETFARYDGPFMAKRRESLRQNAQQYRLALPAMRRFAHNAHARALTDALIARFDTVLGPLTLKQRAMTKVASTFAALEAMRVATGRNAYQPKTTVTRYNVVPAYADLKLPDFGSEPQTKVA